MSSLVISDTEKYGNDSPAVAMSENKPEDRKSAPCIELTGAQLEAFGLASPEVGQSGSATVKFVVKAVNAGDSYGDTLPDGSAPKKCTICLTDAEPANQGPEGSDGPVGPEGAAAPAADDGEDESAEDPEEEAGETPDEETSEESEETPFPPKKPAKKKGKVDKSAALDRVSPGDAGFDKDV